MDACQKVKSSLADKIDKLLEQIKKSKLWARKLPGSISCNINCIQAYANLQKNITAGEQVQWRPAFKQAQEETRTAKFLRQKEQVSETYKTSNNKMETQ